MSELAAAYREHLARRQRETAAALAELGLEALAIASGRPRLRFLDDQHDPFRANPHFLAWVPLPELSDSWLLIRPGQRPRLVYHQPVDYWHQPPPDPGGFWAEHFEIAVIRRPEEALRHLPPPGTRLAVIGEPAAALGHLVPDNPPALLAALDFHRSRKSAYELACHREASLRAARGHLAAERAFREGAGELAIAQAFLAGSEQAEQDPPYHGIVALDEHGAVLHYQHRERRPRARSRSLLIDAGAQVRGYAADVTRTHLREEHGPFAELLAGMERLQQRLVAGVRPGLSFVELHLEAHREIASLLADSGLVRGMAAEAVVESGISRAFFPHGLGHLLGLQVHDVAGHQQDAHGTPTRRPPEHPFLRLTRILEEDMVLTIEPGLYFIPALLAELAASPAGRAVDWALVERLRPYGGIRIEDDVRVTASGCENLTRAAFAALAGAP